MTRQWSRAALTVALRKPARALLLVSAAGWATMAWLLSGYAESRAAGATWHADHAGVSRAAELSHSPGLFLGLLARDARGHGASIAASRGRLSVAREPSPGAPFERVLLPLWIRGSLVGRRCGACHSVAMAGQQCRTYGGRSDSGRAVVLLTGASALPERLPSEADDACVRGGGAV